ncbi:tRNA pseudouridine(38-40) synthase TruA [Cellvibrio japonicus]|uniref:tRNA pseudouridine synthase A n=1 Tax=Cellvibrio japonicus (strain Ueda107) TaxID=498211 RepID=B3PFN7_CELJU|nr:tRNA pseudouridine(38-40) synthase TruA [Cellvibrio japonicus]ACE85102.1 tRNA pseudouridine synthase A [Cellvibrio japonicus Ueda107]
MSQIYPPRIKPYERNGEVLDMNLWPEGMRRVALGVEYKGADFHGFQVQPNGVKTVQQSLEKALSIVADEPITLVCAGRTDAGVHATNQVIHFDTLAQRPLKAWMRGLGPHLPDTIGIRWAQDVSPGFHARFSAQSRTYRYLMSDGASSPALLHDQVSWSSRPLDVALMRQGAACLIGEHDFTSFRATQCQAKSPVRRIEYLHLVRRGELIVMEIRANAFLHHMVRNIVGVLMQVGAGFKKPSWVGDVLAARDRTAAGATAKPNGLYLVAVDYPQEFSLPCCLPGPLFFPEPLGGFADAD